MRIREDVPLAPLTSLRVGGIGRRLVEVEDEAELVGVVRDADARGESVLLLGGGSNVVLPDAGLDGLVVRIATRGVRVRPLDGGVSLEAEAGEPWDALVARCVAEAWRGVELLAGIPGLCGATPVQNVGAYGQEVADSIARVRVYDRALREVRELEASECGFGYRTSRFKGSPRYVVTRVTFALAADGQSVELRYPELCRALHVAEGERVPLADARSTVLALRRAKGMVQDEQDPDSVSAGSFFLNPVLGPDELAGLLARAAARGIDVHAVPRFAAEDGRTKVPAAWLIERAGFVKGWSPFPDGRAGLSAKHTLAIVNRGGATAGDVLGVARLVREGVAGVFGVTLVPEPVIVE